MKTKSLGFIGDGRATKILLQAFGNKGAEYGGKTYQASLKN